jgi:hypothetical protein
MLAKTGGIDSLGGSTDVQVQFNVTVRSSCSGTPGQ